MQRNAGVKIEIPVSPQQIKLPKGVNDRLKVLLDRQDQGELLSAAEKREAKGLVELAEMLSLMRMRSQRVLTRSEA